MRGRDIKRYSYEFADLYLITTFPSLKIDIENYPAVKEHLLSFGKTRLKQKGGKGSRKKTSHKWFETQDSISYWKDFDRQKVIWKRIGSILRFSFDTEKCLGLDSTCIATGSNTEFLSCFLNSKIGRYQLSKSPQTGTGDLIISVQAINPIKVPQISKKINSKFSNLLSEIKNENVQSQKFKDIEQQLDELFYELFELSNKEIEFIKTQ